MMVRSSSELAVSNWSRRNVVRQLRNETHRPTITATANRVRAIHVRLQRYCRISTTQAAKSSNASRTREVTQAKPVNAAGL